MARVVWIYIYCRYRYLYCS